MAKPDKKKLKGFKDFDSSKYINTEPTLDEAVGGTIVLTFGRMNPITVGHEKLVQKVLSVASKEKGTPKVFLTQTQDKKKNPLDYKDKIKFAQKAFGKVVEKSTAKTIIQVAQSVENFDNLVLVVGSDRVKEFDTLLNKYNGKDYNFKSIKVVSAGDRDPDADDVSGMSASKMRALAADGDILQFTKGLPKKLKSSAKAMMSAVRKGMNMTEETENLAEVLSRMQRRKRGLAMRKARFKIKRGREKAKKRTASQEVLKKRARKAAINLFKKKFSKSRRYADLSAGEKEVIDKRVSKINKKRIEQIARKLLPVVKAKERARRKAMMTGGSGTSSSVVKNEGVAQDKDVKDMPGSQPKGYFAGVDKEKKDDRERHFKRNAKKADDDASAYKPAPGDKEAKTKVSKHTKKARDMFGEDNDLWGKRQGKRPHMLLDTNGKPKFDKRFKMYRPKNEEYEEDIAEELLSLIEDTESFELELNEDPTKSLKKKSEKTGMPVGVLRSVYNRGVAAWKTGHRPGTTPEQWGHARVNSFITKSSGTWGKADKDLADKVRKEEVEEGYYSDKDKKQKATLKKHDKRMIKISRDSIKKYEKSKKEENLDENLRKQIAQMASQFPEGSKVKMKHGGIGTVLSVTKDSVKVGVGKKTMNHKPSELIAMKKESGAGFEGTHKLVKRLKKDTPDA